jgi:type IV conjugative transfer system lipoprotein TraV
MDSMNTNQRNVVLAIATALMLSACATTESKFTCPVPDGVKCMPTTEVYERTNFSETVIPRNRDVQMNRSDEAQERTARVDEIAAAAVVNGPVQPVAYRPHQYAQATPNGNSLAVQAPQAINATPQGTSSVVSSATTSNEPHRDAAKILQVWVGAYEDEAGRLHMPTQVFVEIEPRKWSIGHRAAAMNRGFALLEMPAQGAAQDGQERADAGASSR